MGLGEHIPHLLQRIDIPLGHLTLQHGVHHILRDLGSLFVFADEFHDLEGLALLYPVFLDQRKHNIIAASDNLRYGTNTVLDQILGVTHPHSRSVGQTLDLQKIGKALRLRFHQNVTAQLRAHLGKTEGRCFRIDLLRCDTDRLGSRKSAVCSRIGQRYVQNIDAGIFFHTLIFGGNIVTEDVQLENGIVKILELKMGGDNIGIRLIGRMLHRSEIVYIILLRHDDNAAGMLASGTFRTKAATDQPFHLRTVDGNTFILQEVGGIAEGSLIRQGTDGAGLERLSCTEQHLCELMGIRLYVAGEV